MLYKLETNRIIIRSLVMSDAEIIFKNWASDDEVTKYMRWNSHKSINDTQNWIKSMDETSQGRRNYNFLLIFKECNEPFGSISLHYNEEYNMFEVSYILMKKYWNRGLATESLKSIIEFAINSLRQTELFARHEVTNTASGRVLIKAGFIYKKDGLCLSCDGKTISKSKEYFYQK